MKKIIFFIPILILSNCAVIAENTVSDKVKNNEINVETKKVASNRLEFINEAYKFLNTPYKYAGTTEAGIDCSGLIYISALNALNKQLPRSTPAIASFSERIKNEEIQPGDLVFFNTFGNKISHIGIYIGSGEFIHSASSGTKTGVIISSLNEKYWKKRYLFAGRILSAENIFNKKK